MGQYGADARGNRGSMQLSPAGVSAARAGEVADATMFMPALDGVRALAVGAVFLLHLNRVHFPGGALGVDVFFALSAYLITGILLAEQSRPRAIRCLLLAPGVSLGSRPRAVGVADCQPDRRTCTHARHDPRQSGRRPLLRQRLSAGLDGRHRRRVRSVLVAGRRRTILPALAGNPGVRSLSAERIAAAHVLLCFDRRGRGVAVPRRRLLPPDRPPSASSPGMLGGVA